MAKPGRKKNSGANESAATVGAPYQSDFFATVQNKLHWAVHGRTAAELIVERTDASRPNMGLAFREAVANAICHRDYATGGSSIGVAMYDDRLEVTSSGTLHFGFTPQTLFEPHESRPWNPLIASVFYRRGIIETWGQGTLKMAAWTEAAGLLKPEILEIPGAVVVRFRGRTLEKGTGEGLAPQKTPQKAWPNAQFGSSASPAACNGSARTRAGTGR